MNDSYYDHHYSSKLIASFEKKQEAMETWNKLENEEYEYNDCHINGFVYRDENFDNVKEKIIVFIEKHGLVSEIINESDIDTQKISMRDLIESVWYQIIEKSHLEEFRQIIDVNFYELLEYDEEPFVFVGKLGISNYDEIYVKSSDCLDIYAFSSEADLIKYFYESYDFERFCEEILKDLFSNNGKKATDFPEILEGFLNNSQYFTIYKSTYSDENYYAMKGIFFDIPFYYDNLTESQRSELNTFLGLLKIQPYEILKVTEKEYQSLNEGDIARFKQ